VAVKPDRQ